jgi:hypothetical protein
MRYYPFKPSIRSGIKKLFLGFCWLAAIQIGVAKEIIFPMPTGPYSVGTQALELMDNSRPMLRGKDKRRWMIQAFYPIQKHTGLYPYMPGTLKNGEVHGVPVLSWAKVQAVPITHQSLPVIIFIPGRGMIRQQYTILLEELASHGYVVLAMDQPYVANFVQFPDGSSITLLLKMLGLCHAIEIIAILMMMKLLEARWGILTIC